MAVEEQTSDSVDHAGPYAQEPIIERHSSYESNTPRILAFFSGKGGVGNSMLCANIGVYLAQMGKRVLLVDGVRWGQNLHTLLGISPPRKTVDFLEEESEHLEDLIVETPFVKLKLISGMRESSTHNSAIQCPYLIRKTRGLPFDLVIMDLGSHLCFNLFDHAIWADYAVITAVPEPTAIERTYELLRSLFFRLFKTIETKLQIEDVVEKAMMNRRELGIKTPRDLVSAVRFFDPAAGDLLFNEVERMKLRLLLNQSRSSAEAELGSGIISACKRYFGMAPEYLGTVDHDSSVFASVRQRKPLHIVSKDSKATEQIEYISHKLLSQEIKDKQDEKQA